MHDKRSTTTIHHGVKSCKVRINTISQEDQKLIIEPKMFEELSLPKTTTEYRVKIIQPGEWILGPFVGVFTSEGVLEKLLSQVDISIYARYAEILECNQGLVVFFSLERILWDKGLINGVMRDSSKSEKVWQEQIIPIPTVIYDRSYGSESRIEAITLRNKCAALDKTIKVLNGLPSFRKMEIYQLCSQDETLSPHIPQWELFRPETAEALFTKFPMAYIKPNDLSKGMGVTKVLHTSKEFLIEQGRGKEIYHHQCESVQEVLDVLGDYLKEPLVIQEAIPLREYNGNPFDLRLLLQKEHTGRWQQTAIVARIFGENKVATYDEVMEDLSQVERERIASLLLNLTLEIAERIELKYGVYAELGFDFGVDLKGKVWLMEVNGKPLKVSVERLNDETMTAAAYENPLKYAIYLSGFDYNSRSNDLLNIRMEDEGISEAIGSAEIGKTSKKGGYLKLSSDLVDTNLRLIEKIASKGMPHMVENQGKITKKETYEHLVKYPRIKNHIPLFSPYTPEKLTQMIEQTDSISIKPVSCYKGQDVLRVTRKDSKFILEFPRENEKKVCEDLLCLLNELNHILLSNHEYMIQESIQLATFLGNTFDIRVILRKKDSIWKVRGLNVLSASTGSVITSPRGGKVFRLSGEKLALSFPLRDKEIIQRTKFLAEVIGYAMEDKYDYLGELEIDLGIDANGKAWVIRVNRRSPRANFNLMRDKTISKLKSLSTVRYFGKWQTFKALSFFEETKEFIPETTPLSLEELECFLNKYEFCFVRSNYGGSGAKVLRVERQGDLCICTAGGAKLKEWSFNSTKELHKFLVEKLGTQTILQKGISLAKINQGVFDIQVLCQKNSRGQWNIKALNFRTAPMGATVTDYSAGAEETLVPPGGVIPYTCLSWDHLTIFTKKVLFALESSFGPLGKIELDVGIDAQGKLWLIGANSKGIFRI